MIPRQLQIKNFLSYGPEPQTINFAHYNLICLSGKNGHGKSALLDAITWAIWGQARKTSGNSKADAGLLHLGQKHMFVILEFEVSGQLFRIRREFVQTASKPFASLDFGIMQDEGKIIALTDKTIKATQEKIERTIGITYESFINSAFLRQGQSNEFSKKSPKERKEILAEILQLNQFEEQKKIALLHAKKLQVEYKTACNIQQRIETELEQLTNINEQYEIILKTLQEHDFQKKELATHFLFSENKKNKLLQQSKELEFIQKQHDNIEQQLVLTKKSILEISQAWQDSEKTQSAQYQKELEFQQKSLQELVQSMQEKLQKKLIFKETYLTKREEFAKFTAEYEKTFDKEFQNLQIETTKTHEQFLQIEQRRKQELNLLNKIIAEKKSLEKEVSDLQDLSLKNNFDLQQYQEQENDFEKIKFEYQQISTQSMLLKEQLLHIEEQHNNIQNLQSPCPLCSHPLTEVNQKSVQTKFENEQAVIQQKVRILKEQTNILNQEIKKTHIILQEIKQKHEKSINLATKHAELSKGLQKLFVQKQEQEQLIAELTKQESEITKFFKAKQKELEAVQTNKNNIAQTEQYKSFQATLTAIEIAAKELGYNPEAHKKAELDLQKVNKQLLACSTTANESEKQAERKANLAALTKTTQILTEQQKIIAEQVNSYQNIDLELKQLLELQKDLNNQQISLEQKQSQLFMEKGSLEQKQKKQKDLQVELHQLIKEIQIVHQEMFDYTEIAKALGKDGIQALLIEQAIPEIENETNEILARLTNNQTQIFIESLRDLKKGGSKETLDIKISDSFGLRDYELFSGGEAFRIDFALRIGISKLLARRAGTTLQTIFIDEGFGSQDEEGLQLIMDNLYKIQNDFSKIIIVSHLSEMKEQFPVQFIVEKKRMGSTVTIVEQG